MKEKNLDYWKTNAEEDYINTPISVLRYISELEATVENYRILYDCKTLKEMIILKDYYQSVSETYKGGCYNSNQVEANKKVEFLEKKIEDVYHQLNINKQ